MIDFLYCSVNKRQSFTSIRNHIWNVKSYLSHTRTWCTIIAFCEIANISKVSKLLETDKNNLKEIFIIIP